jgi:heme O synthase-like polyprenyltransferase
LAIGLAVIGSVVYYGGIGKWGVALIVTGGAIGVIAAWRGDMAVDSDIYRMDRTPDRERRSLNYAPLRAKIAIVLGFVVGGIGLIVLVLDASSVGGLLLGTGGIAMAAGMGDAIRNAPDDKGV